MRKAGGFVRTCPPERKMRLLVKRKPKRRKLRRPAYYTQALPEATSIKEILELVDDAAHQPMRYIGEKDYEKIFWQAQALLEKKGE